MVGKADKRINRPAMPALMRCATMKSKFRLLQVSNGIVRKQFPLIQGVNTIGRSPHFPICLSEPSVSRRHAELIVSGTRITVRDVGSRYGTFIEGRQIQTLSLRPGQWIQLAEVRLLLATDDEEQELDFGSDIGTDDPRFLKDRFLRLPSELKSKFAPRQQEVLESAWRGRAKKQIAAELGISIETVKCHLKEIYSICQVHSISELQHHICRCVIQTLTADNDDIAIHRPPDDGSIPDRRHERRA